MSKHIKLFWLPLYNVKWANLNIEKKTIPHNINPILFIVVHSSECNKQAINQIILVFTNKQIKCYRLDSLKTSASNTTVFIFNLDTRCHIYQVKDCHYN